MKSPLSYIGGKSKLSESIVKMIPKHKTYIEVFAGAAWVFFNKEPSQYEVINDKDGELISFYRVLQSHLEEFLKQFKWLLSSRELWHDWNKQLAAGGLTDIQRAARYYYVQRLSFGGKVAGRTFGTVPEGRPRVNIVRMEEELSAVHLRLSSVQIENLDWSEILKRYDKPAAFFYLDPPYLGSPVYKHNFYDISDYVKMAETLKTITGKFVFSINDRPDIRAAFDGFKILPVTLNYSVSKTKATEGKELIIRNF
jgi:DNA adenine methylase